MEGEKALKRSEFRIFLFALILLCEIFLPKVIYAKVKYGSVVTTNGPKKLFFEDHGDYGIIEGDILVHKVIKNKSSDKSVSRRLKCYRWENGVIPYEIDDTIPNKERIYWAIDHYHQNTSIKLIPRTNEKDYIYFKNNGNESCSSFVGRSGGRQIINIPDWCEQGSVVHEIMHAIGFYHEQSRPDRMRHLKIKWSNIKFSNRGNFLLKPFAKSFGDFDFDSIMLYGPYSFAKDPQKPTITKRDGSLYSIQRSGLSEQNILAIESLYNKN